MKVALKILAMTAAFAVFLLPFIKPDLFEFKDERTASAGGVEGRPRLASSTGGHKLNYNQWQAHIAWELLKPYFTKA